MPLDPNDPATFQPTGPHQSGPFVCPYCAGHARGKDQQYMPCVTCRKHWHPDATAEVLQQTWKNVNIGMPGV